MDFKVSRWFVILAVLASALPIAPALAQVEGNLSSYTGKNAEGYLKPIQEGFGSGLQDALFRSAYIPKTGPQLNVEVKAMFVMFGDDDKTFEATTEDGFLPVTTVEAPTVIGATEAVVVPGDNGATAAFPGGFDIGSLALAVPQLTFGGFAGTQGVVRYIALDVGDAEIGDLSLIGLGARHSISQYFENSPVDLAGGIFWQQFKLGDDLIDATGFSVGVQGSRQYGVVEPYLGLSYDTFSMTVDYESEAVGEALSVDFDGVSSLHITAGLGLNLSYLHLHGEISSASQTSFAFGLSVGN